MLSRNLEKSLHRALAYANERRHEYATVEHLLLALTEDQDAVGVLHACGVDLEGLRREILSYVDNELGSLVSAHGDDAKPTASFQRVLQRAAIHVQSSGREEVTGANVLVAMFAERESHAAYYLHEQDMTRFDAVNYNTHGIAKVPGRSETGRVQRMDEDERVNQVRRKRRQDRLQQNYRRGLSLALTDPLTNLYVRRYGEAHLDELIERVNQHVTSAAVLLFDVDHLKRVNDTHGHDEGDDVLRELAARTIKSIRSVDLGVRLGGEEFLVVMPEIDLANAAAVAERLRTGVARDLFTVRSSGEKLAVTISVGVAAVIAGADDRDRLLKRADDALCCAKSAGRNCVVVR